MIAVFGEALVDLFALPLGASVDTATSFAPCVGGAPANVAITLARLGVPSRLIGAVGTDAHGLRLAHALVAEGVDTAALLTVPQRTGITFVRVAPNGERSFLFYRRDGADLSLTVDHLRALSTHPLSGAQWLHVNSTALVAEPLAGAAKWLLGEAARMAVPLSLDINLRAHLWQSEVEMRDSVRWLAAQAAWVKASEEDLTAMGLAPALDSLAVIAPAAVHVLTLAERGACARLGGLTVSVPAPAVTTVDATGAGDAFTAGVLSVLHRRAVPVGGAHWLDAELWREALAWGCSLGARAVTAVGATEALRNLAKFSPEAQEVTHGR